METPAMGTTDLRMLAFMFGTLFMFPVVAPILSYYLKNLQQRIWKFINKFIEINIIEKDS